MIVLDPCFNLTNKSNLIDRLEYDLIRFFDHLVVAYFLLGHPVGHRSFVVGLRELFAADLAHPKILAWRSL